MRIHASIRPPDHVVAHLESALGPERNPYQVSWLDPPHWRVHLAGFGNVVLGDAVRLSEVLALEVGRLPRPRLRLSGVVPLPEDWDDSVSVGVEGDVDTIARVASSIPQWVYGFGFVLDRRAFRPLIRLGRVTTLTTVPYLERLASRLGAYRGAEWTADQVALGRETRSGAAGEAGYDAFATVPFAGRHQGEPAE